MQSILCYALSVTHLAKSGMSGARRFGLESRDSDKCGRADKEPTIFGSDAVQKDQR